MIWLLTIDCRLIEEVIRRLVLSGGEAGLVGQTGGVGCGSLVVGLELRVDRQVIVPPDLALVLHGRARPVLLLLSNVRVREYFSHGKNDLISNYNQTDENLYIEKGLISH